MGSEGVINYKEVYRHAVEDFIDGLIDEPFTSKISLLFCLTVVLIGTSLFPSIKPLVIRRTGDRLS